jgi:pimeloyl-ACP methyl ester carboxylesterase
VTYPLELVAFETADDLRLDGLYIAPRGDLTIVHVHGKCGNFYQNDFLKPMFARFAAGGLGFLTFNHRGHDCVAEAYRRGAVEYIGGSMERFSDCVVDIDAAIAFARDQASRVVIQGHSNGAEKVVYYALAKPDAVEGVVLISASDSYEMQRRYRPQEMPDAQGARLGTRKPMQNRIDLLDLDEYGIRTGGKDYPIPVTRESLVDVLTGPSLSVLRLSQPWSGPTVNVAVLLCVGECDPYLTVAPDRLREEIRARLGADITLELVLAADHHFHDHEDELACRIVRWAQRLSPGREPGITTEPQRTE